MADKMTTEERIASSQSLNALASYFKSPVAVADPSLRFLPRTPPPPRADNKGLDD